MPWPGRFRHVHLMLQSVREMRSVATQIKWGKVTKRCRLFFSLALPLDASRELAKGSSTATESQQGSGLPFGMKEMKEREGEMASQFQSRDSEVRDKRGRVEHTVSRSAQSRAPRQNCRYCDTAVMSAANSCNRDIVVLRACLPTVSSAAFWNLVEWWD